MGKIIELLSGFLGASWRTSLLGWIGIVTGVGMLLNAGGAFAAAALDGKPETVPDWETVSIAWVALLVGIKGIVSRDNAVSSTAVKEIGVEVK